MKGIVKNTLEDMFQKVVERDNAQKRLNGLHLCSRDTSEDRRIYDSIWNCANDELWGMQTELSRSSDKFSISVISSILKDYCESRKYNLEYLNIDYLMYGGFTGFKEKVLALEALGVEEFSASGVIGKFEELVVSENFEVIGETQVPFKFHEYGFYTYPVFRRKYDKTVKDFWSIPINIADDRLDEVIEIGSFSDKDRRDKYTVIIWPNDIYNIPHFHLIDKATRGRKFHAYIKMNECGTFSHGKNESYISLSKRRKLLKFLKKKSTMGEGTVWDRMVNCWNKNPLTVDLDKTAEIPNYLELPKKNTIASYTDSKN